MMAEPSAETPIVRPGLLFLVVGPSGAGKDSLIHAARKRLAGHPRLVFARRTITRAGGSGGEDHLAVPPEAFEYLESTGQFCLSWRAHGLAYGLPLDLTGEIAAGRCVVANVSRTVIEDACRRFPRVRVILVTAAMETLRQRLAKRGREAPGEVARRLSRAELALPPECEVVVVRNDGALETALGDFLVALEAV